jgi:hypothetical protein
LDETRAFQAATAFVSVAPLQGYSFATARLRLADNGWAQFVASSQPPPPPPLLSVASNGDGNDDRKDPQEYEKS